MISNRRRITIIIVSVSAGTILSVLMFKLRRGGAELSSNDVNMLITNLVFSLAIILGGWLYVFMEQEKRFVI